MYANLTTKKEKRNDCCSGGERERETKFGVCSGLDIYDHVKLMIKYDF